MSFHRIWVDGSTERAAIDGYGMVSFHRIWVDGSTAFKIERVVGELSSNLGGWIDGRDPVQLLLCGELLSELGGWIDEAVLLFSKSADELSSNLGGWIDLVRRHVTGLPGELS